MKKMLFSGMIVAAAMVGSCTSKGGTELKTDMDSLSYAIGVTHEDGLKPYMAQMIDSAYYDDFFRGLKESSSTSNENKKQWAYYMGLNAGIQFVNTFYDQANMQMFRGDTINSLDKAKYLAGFMAAATEKNLKMTLDSARVYSENMSQKIATAALEKEFGPNKVAGEQFLAENKGKEGVVTLPDGLQYKIITEGKGAIPTASDMVKVHYRGTLLDGTEFDSSYERNEPAVFGVSGVITGWTEALMMMPVGSKWMLYIPQELAYGTNGYGGSIPPFSMLTFEVELLEIVK